MEKRTTVELNDLCRRVAEWREKDGGRGSRIPDQMWRDAVRVARVEGVWATAKALRFNYEALRNRLRQSGDKGTAVDWRRKGGGAAGEKLGVVGMAKSGERSPAGVSETRARRNEVPTKGSAGPSFIALEMGQLGGASRTVIELLGRHGDRMRVDVAGGVDLVAVVQTFWSRQP